LLPGGYARDVERTIRLGGRDVVRMGLGTNRLTATTANVDFIRKAASSGLGLIDTAHLYTGGASESTIGLALDGTTTDVVVATKGGFRPREGKPETLRAQIQASLERLRTDRIFLYYLHRVDPETPFETTLEVLAEHRQRGVIQNVGLSEVGVEQLERARQMLPISAVQNHYNLDERRWEDVVDYCTEQDIAFVPFYPLHAEPSRLRAIADAHQATPAQIALAWLLRRSPQILPIPGTLSIEHVRENIGALDVALTDEEYAELA
jgi:pyridoxine 4-dehydrogenase